jgi:hypothetical protein
MFSVRRPLFDVLRHFRNRNLVAVLVFAYIAAVA